MNPQSAAIVLLAFFFSTEAFCQTKWEWRNPLPQGNQLLSVAFGKGVFVAVGWDGSILYSKNAVEWNKSGNSYAKSLNSVVFGTDFVIVGNEGTILFSSDGISWNTIKPDTIFSFSEVTYRNGTYAAFGKSASDPMFFSCDGKQWNKKYNYWTDKSLDTIHWRSSPLPSAALQHTPVAFGNGIYVGVGCWAEYSISTDGFRWTKHEYKGFHCPYAITFGNGIFVAAGSDGELHTSPDGLNWQKHDPLCPAEIMSLAYGQNKFVAVAWTGEIFTSENGIKWTRRTAGPTNYMKSLSFNGKRFVLTGGDWQYDGISLTSLDGIKWEQAHLNSKAHINALIWNNRDFVAFTNGDKSDTTTSVFFSKDAIKWKKSPFDISGFIRSAAFGNGQYVGVGKELIVHSSDGFHWSKAPGTFQYSRSVTFGNGLFVAVSQGDSLSSNEVVLTSPDGISWKKTNSGTKYYLNSVAYGNGIYVIVGSNPFDSSIILSSPDARKWAIVEKGTYRGLESVAWCGSLFMAVGSRGTIVTSPDARSWTLRPRITTQNLLTVGYGKNRFVAAGNDGAIISSEKDPRLK